MVQLLLVDSISTLYKILPERRKRENVNDGPVHHGDLFLDRPYIRLEGLEDALDRRDHAVGTGAVDHPVATGPEEGGDGILAAEHFFCDP